MGFPCGSAGKESACNVGDLDSILGLGRSPGEENSYPFQYPGRENGCKMLTTAAILLFQDQSLVSIDKCLIYNKPYNSSTVKAKYLQNF